MFKVKYNNEKAVTCYNGEIPALEILRNYVQNSYKISVYRDTIIVATKDKKLVAITGMEGLLDILEPFDTVYVFKKDEITFDYNNKELMENFINNNDINIIDPENIENSNIKINRTNDSIINIPTPVQETPVVETSLQTEPVPTINTVNVAPITQVTSVETKKKSKAPLIIIILILLIGLGIAAYFLIPKMTNESKASNNGNNKNTSSNKNENSIKENEVLYVGDDRTEKSLTIPENQKIILIFKKKESYSSAAFINEDIDLDDFELSLMNIQNDSDFYYSQDYAGIEYGGLRIRDLKNISDDYLYKEVEVKNGVLEIPSEIDGKKVRIIGHSDDGAISSTIFCYRGITEEIVNLLPIITEIKIPDTVIEIKGRAFAESFLKKLDLPNSIKVIDQEAFEDNINLTEVVLPNNLYNIDNNAFDGCKRLKSVKTRDADQQYSKYDIVLTSKNKTFHLGLNTFDNCPNLKTMAFINNNGIDAKSFSFYSHKKLYLEELLLKGNISLYKFNSDIPLKKLTVDDIGFMREQVTVLKRDSNFINDFEVIYK